MSINFNKIFLLLSERKKSKLKIHMSLKNESKNISRSKNSIKISDPVYLNLLVISLNFCVYAVPIIFLDFIYKFKSKLLLLKACSRVFLNRCIWH